MVILAGKDDLIDKSVVVLIKTMEVASLIGADGVIFHGGSHKGKGFDKVYDQAVDTLRKVLESSPDNVWLCLENSAGMGAHIGSSFQEMGALINGVNHPNLKVCLDTEHLFAAGYNIASPKEIKEV